MKIFFLVTCFLFIFCSCEQKESYSIDSVKLSTNQVIESGFNLYELKVDDPDDQAYPFEDKIQLVATCIPNNLIGRNRAKLLEAFDSLIWENEGRLVDSTGEPIDFGFEPQSEIFFYKLNANYKWRVPTRRIDSIQNIPITSPEDLNTLPFTLKKETWYKIVFPTRTSYKHDDFYFFQRSKGDFDTRHHTWNEPTNF